MFNFQRFKTHLYLKGFTKTPRCYLLLQHYPFSPMSLKYSTITSDQYSFTVSYLIKNCGFSPETALNASKQVRFQNAQKPDSVLAFFRNHGFSNSQINSIIRRVPKLLSCDPHKRVLPKFEFLLSKGASTSDIVLMVTRSPRFVCSSLENNIIPKYGFLRRFFQSDKKVIDCVVFCPTFFASDRVAQNVKLLLDDGVRDSNITYLFRTRPSIFLSRDLRKAVDEVKELGFDPSKSSFSLALLAKRAMAKSRWDAKVEAFKSWGWSEEAISIAFRSNPNCMLVSKDKINAVLSFWVNQLGWNSLVPVKMPGLLGYSLEKRIIPRAFVVQYLLTKGLRNKDSSLLTPFVISEKLFLEKYVNCFKEETSQLLKIYQEKMNLQDSREDGSVWHLSNG